MVNLGHFAAYGGSMAGSAWDGSAATDARAWNGSNSKAVDVKISKLAWIDGLISGTKWKGPITYSAPNAIDDYQPDYFEATGTAGFKAFNAKQMKAFHFALDAKGFGAGFSVEGFTKLDISFKAGGSGAGTIRGAVLNDANPTAYAYYPSNGDYGGDTFFGSGADLKAPKAGNYGWHTMLHELGHALGLKHGHESGDVSGRLPRGHDSVEYSVMTYNTFVGDNASGYKYENWGAPQTYMMLDIAALQHMYGADFTTNAGNTTYKWNPGSGKTFINGKVAIDAGGNRIFATIWDGAGTDTYDLTAYRTAVSIDLRPGESSTFSQKQLAYLGGGPNDGYARGNIFNALQYKNKQNDLRSLIENAKGGSGNDTILGNKAKNTLWGNKGDDRLSGEDGNDTLFGGAGRDRLDGGKGNDLAYGGADGDHLYGGASNDRLYGDVGADYLYGGAGNDRLYGGAGEDYLDGGAGTDLIYGGAGNDTLWGDAGNDKLYGDAGQDTLNGEAGNDKLYGGAGNDTLLRGAAGHDWIYGGEGNDTLWGEAGNDRLYGGAGNDQLHGGPGYNHVYGGAGDDVLSGDPRFDALYGGEGYDRLYIPEPVFDYWIDEVGDGSGVFEVLQDGTHVLRYYFPDIEWVGIG